MTLKGRVSRLEGGGAGAGWRRFDPACGRVALAASGEGDAEPGALAEVMVELRRKAAVFEASHEFKTRGGQVYIRERRW